MSARQPKTPFAGGHVDGLCPKCGRLHIINPHPGPAFCRRLARRLEHSVTPTTTRQMPTTTLKPPPAQPESPPTMPKKKTKSTKNKVTRSPRTRGPIEYDAYDLYLISVMDAEGGFPSR